MLILFDVWNFEVKFYSFCTQCAFSSSDATACFSYLLYPIKSSKCQTYSVSTLFELSKFFLKAHFLLWNGVNEFNSEILYLRICSDEKKNWCFLPDLFWEICVTLYTYMLSGYLLVGQSLHKVFPKHLFSCLVDLRLFSDNLHQINIGKKDKIFMYIIKYIVVIYHICHWLKKQR